MQLTFDESLAERYTSASQKARVLTEDWVDRSVFCPNCGYSDIDKYPNNRPVADFYCSNCKEQYELKSKQKSVGTKIVDGAYHTMIERLESNNNPNFFLLNYDLRTLAVLNFFVIPKHFFVPSIIEKRKPLANTARRAGWVGCNILLENLPRTGKIYLINNSRIENKNIVLGEWRKTLFLREEDETSTRKWLLDVMRCIEKLGKQEFSLAEMYKFEDELAVLHPGNKHIKDKIRQQLQILRDKKYLDFISRGLYKLRR